MMGLSMSQSAWILLPIFAIWSFKFRLIRWRWHVSTSIEYDPSNFFDQSTCRSSPLFQGRLFPGWPYWAASPLHGMRCKSFRWCCNSGGTGRRNSWLGLLRILRLGLKQRNWWVPKVFGGRNLSQVVLARNCNGVCTVFKSHCVEYSCDFAERLQMPVVNSQYSQCEQTYADYGNNVEYGK